jgi:hypothetical protein
VAIPKGPDGRLDRARLETAVKHGFRVVRWHLDEPEESVPPAATKQAAANSKDPTTEGAGEERARDRGV